MVFIVRERIKKGKCTNIELKVIEKLKIIKLKRRYYVVTKIIDSPPSMAFMVAKDDEIIAKVDCIFDNGIENITYSCLKLQTRGILCSHIFDILNQLGYRKIFLCCIWSC